MAKRSWQAVFALLQDVGQALAEVRNAFGNDDAEFSQKASDLVGLCGPGLDETLAGTMQSQDGCSLSARNAWWAESLLRKWPRHLQHRSCWSSHRA
jgi:hypothetical protein